MNLQEFAALKEGDTVYNGLTQTRGTVTSRERDGVKVRWGDGQPGRTVEFFFSVNGTAWFHWHQEETPETPLDNV